MAGRRTSQSGSGDLRPWVCLALMAGALTLRTLNRSQVDALGAAVRETVWAGQDHRQAVAAAGRAVLGEQDNAILVFGRALLETGMKMGEAMLT